MASQPENFVQGSVDRIREAFASMDDEIQRVQKRVQREFQSRRKTFEKRTQQQVKRLRRNDYVKRVQAAVDDATKQFEKSVDNLLGFLNVASKRDLHRIDRKLNQMSRKLRDLEHKILQV